MAAIEVVKLVAEPIKRQFNYLCCFTSNIDNLKLETEELDMATRELERQLHIERRNLKDAVPEVITWLDECQKMIEQKDTILPNVKDGCLKLGARFSLSRRARKTADQMKKLLARKNFNPIARERPLGATQEVPLGKTYELESRTKFEEEIMTTLRDVDVNRIGICGMGGLGKTTIAQRIRNRVLKEHVFKEVAMAVVSQQVDKSKIQVEIGGSLGLRLVDDTSQVRAQKLHARLTGTERILLILDDVWEGLELESLGIPRDSKGCTILITSRNGDALSDMDVQKFFLMEILSVEEAWFLFRERVGTCVDDAELNSIAKEVVKECGGLPIALTAVGLALKDEKNVHIWDDALLQLRFNQDIPEYDRGVYNPLKLSYDFLSSKAAKSLLLLCCLFPEDAMIPLEQLTYMCMGLGIFEGIGNLEGVRNRISTLTKILTSRSLLLSEIWRDECCVRMHDVVRDVCTIIGKNEKYIGGNDCAWISSYELSEFRTELGFPNLRLLLLEDEFKFDESVFLEGIRDLHVLWIEFSTLMTSLPHAAQRLKNLQTLVLVSCEGLKTISVVGELVNLKILICHYCTSLEELPTEIKSNRLKLLELADCDRLQSIGRGIISSLVGLEELKMLRSFNKWEGENREERKNAGLRELEALTNLTCLEIEIEDPTLVAEKMQISTKLERFCISFDRYNYLPKEVHNCDKKIYGLRLERETCLGHWIEMQLLRETEYLSLWGNGAMNIDFVKSQHMRWLRLSRCDDIDATLFPASLEHMYLESLPQLQEISFSSFQNLSSVEISNCDRLRSLAKLSTAGEYCLSQLEKLSIVQCEMIEQVLLWKEIDSNRKNSESRINSSHVKFPKLKELRLVALPNLATLCRGIEGIEFPLLRKICIRGCPKWTSMVPIGTSESRENKSGLGSSSSNADIDDDNSSHLFCQSEKVSLGNLKELTTRRNPFCGHKIPVSSFNGLEILSISWCHGSKSLISSSIATNLTNLKSLSILKCDEIVQVVKDEDKEDKLLGMANINGGERKIVLFPKLEELELSNLPKLVSFCERKTGVELPSLSRVIISHCRNMKHFSSGPLTASNLKFIAMDYEDIGGENDLNGFLQQRAMVRTTLKHFELRTKFEEVPFGKTCEFESRRKDEEDIITTLRDGHVNRIGICGMGGLGKTTMAQRIMNRVLKEHVFKEAAMAVVSQQVDKSKIQVEIGGSLGMKNLQDDTSQVRAQKLHARLTSTERILLILDDVWEGLELESLGIPRDSKGCTILVTSRNEDALRNMDVQKVLWMKILTVEEAWFLFTERVGTCVDDAELNSIAKEVVKECGGLPIALAAVGAELKDEKDMVIWKYALRQLRQCDQDIPSFIARVYNPLKLSYEFLSSKAAKSLLLLCCLFPEDARIPLEQLTYICMGLGIFEGIRNLEGARNRISSLAETLSSRSLLLSEINSMDERCVRMHDVVRDVCIIIARNEKYIGGNDCAWISSYELIGERSEFPNLRLLLLEKEFKFDSVFLEGIRDLHVLWIKCSTLTLLPHATQRLKNLQTLVLVSCEGLKTISVVGELVNLKILICRNCTSLEELPTEIKRLNRLKLLELTWCYRLESIGRGIISSLVGLEELTMLNSFRKWEADDREERKNAGLRELEALSNLTCLEIEIEDPALMLVAENMHISTKLKRFHVRFDINYDLPEEVHNYDKKMSLLLERESCLGHWIEMQLLRDTEYLSLWGNGAKDVDLGRSQNIKWLRLRECDDVDATLFPASLEHMQLYNLPQLQEISIYSFQNLSSIEISGCSRLRNLAKFSIAGEDCLPQLEKLHIKECEMIEQVLLWKEEDSNRNNSESRINSHVKFPKLKEVTLSNLPNLATFCQGIEGIECPLLRKIDIQGCPKWKSMVPSGISESRENKSGGGSSSSNADTDDDYSSHLFCQSEKVSLGNLKELYITRNPFCGHKIPVSSFNGLEILSISWCHGSKSLISSSIATILTNLKSLSILKCDEIVQVVKDEDKEDKLLGMANINGGERKIVLFPKLEELELSNLPKLVSFCERKSGVGLPSLSKVEISDCPNMKHFCSGPLTAPNLKFIKMNYEDIGGEKYLNGVLQQRAKEKEEEEEKKKEKEKEKEKKEGGEEAQESKGEIEEERN